MEASQRRAGNRGAGLAAAAATLVLGVLLSASILTEPALGRLSGRVYASNLKPIPGARVTLVPAESDFEAAREAATARTRSDGSFTIHAVPAGSYTVTASSKAHGVSGPTVEIEEGRTTPVALRLSRTLSPLTCSVPASIFLPTEPARVTIGGYVQDDVRNETRPEVVLSRVDMEACLSTATGVGAFRETYAAWSAPETPPHALARVASPVASYAPPLRGADIEGYFEQQVRMGRLTPGAYVATVRYGSRQTYVAFQVTDLAIVAKTTRSEVHAMVTDLVTGRAMPGATVRCFRSGTDTGSGVTQADGMARVKVAASVQASGTSSSNYSGVVASAQGRYACAFGWQYNNARGADPIRVHGYTERPIYRPGQEVRYKAILRTPAGPGPVYSVPVGTRVSVRAEDPDGIILDQQSLMTNAYGSVSGSFRLSSETPSGSGTVFLDVPGSPGEAFSFTIASYRKPEFTVTARAKRRAYISGETAEVEVSAEYYYGAPVAGATVKYRAMWQSLWEWEPNHAPYDGYEAEWGQRSAGVSPADLSGTATLDQQGRTIVRLPAGDVGGPQALQGNQLSVWVEVTDGARRWAEATAETRVYAGSVRLFLRPAGYVLIPGRSVSFVVQATDLVGKPVHSLPVTLEVERESRDGSKVASHRVGAVAGATDGRGLASLAFTPSKSGELLVTASARDPQGRRVAAATYVWSVSDAGGDIAGETATLELHTDKQRYSIGDTARVLINTDLVGADALVTVESGDVVHRAMVVPLRQRSTVLLLPVGRECAPNAELSVCAVGRKTFHSNSAPIRVSVPDRTLKVTLSPASGSVRPGSQTRFRLSVTNQRGDPVRAEASLAVVDEAIYQLEEDTPGAIADAFYPETYSRVQTWHSCPDRLYSGDKGKPRIEARRKFEDAPFWAPHLVTDDAGSAEVGVRLPDNLTTWRATAIVHSLKSQFGYSTARVVATLPFHVRLQIPRFVTQSDRVQAVASVTNASGVQRAVQVRLTGRGVTVAGAPTRTVTVEPSGVVEVPWLVEARVPGAAQLKVEAWSSAPTMLTDGVEQTIEVRPMAREVTHVFAGSIQPQGRSVHQFDAPAGVAPGALSVRITPSPIAAIPAALSYVELFPYACTEQTISGFLPSLMVRRLLRALPDPTAHSLQAALGRAGTVPIEDSVRDGLTRLRVLQRSDGSWGWFENDAGDPWLTAYALLALAEARRDGLTMHRHMADEGCQAAMRLLNNSEPDDRAFLALGLAHFGKNALHRLNLPRLSAGGLVCAAQAMRVLRVNGKRLSEVERRLLATTRTVSGMAVWPGRGPRFASQWTGHIATAMVVRYLLETQPSSALPDEAVRYLMVSRTDDHWSSTRDTAFVLMALCDYARARPQGGAAPKDVIVRLNGSVAATLEADSIPDREPEARVRVAGLPIRPGRNTVSVECASSARPYYSVAVRTQSAGTMDRPDSTLRGAVLTRTYDALRHSTLPLRGTVRHYEPIRGSVAGGTVVRCRLVVKVEDNLAFVMITDPIPACLEPNARGEVDADWNEWYSDTDVRDDRVVFFARRMPRGRHVIEYFLRAQTPGRCTALPARLEAMYNPEVRVETRADTVQVR